MSGRRRVLVFIHINKTAGTTLRYILRSSYGTRHCDVEPWHGPWTDPPFSTSDLQRVRRLYPRLASIAGHRISGHIELEEAGTDLRYVTFLREPIALCASRFQYRLDHRKRSDLSFEEWIQKDWARDAQTQRIGGTADANDAIAVIRRKNMFVGLTEAFDESMIVLRALRAPDLDIQTISAVVVGRKIRWVLEMMRTNARGGCSSRRIEPTSSSTSMYSASCSRPSYTSMGPHCRSRSERTARKDGRASTDGTWRCTASSSAGC